MGRAVFALSILLTLLCSDVYGRTDTHGLHIASWNVENLFDTIPSPLHADDDFTPEGACHWTGHRYWSKLGKLSRIIAGLGGDRPCDIIGLCEVENDSVVYDLTRRTSLGRLGYEYYITDGPDARGINVALLYQPLRFRPLATCPIRVAPPKGERATRDMLHVTGLTYYGDTLDVVMVHLPSRKGGNTAAKYRRNIGERLSNYTDSLLSVRQRPRVVVMGDFNAEPKDAVFRKVLQNLRLLTAGLKGSYRFQREWSQIDHFLVNPDFATECRACVFSSPALLKETPTGVTPYRTFLGTYYQGGISDHLPIILTISQLND